MYKAVLYLLSIQIHPTNCRSNNETYVSKLSEAVKLCAHTQYIYAKLREDKSTQIKAATTKKLQPGCFFVFFFFFNQHTIVISSQQTSKGG